MKRTTLVVAAALALVAALPGAPANAQALRTFVSTTGSDTNPCSITQPCRHFQAAVNATAAGGEVDALDGGYYSPIMINKPITIEGQGWSYLAPANGGNGITINAVSGNVTIRGVSINGVGTTGGTNGIVFNSGGSLTVTNCVAQNLAYDGVHNATGNGILMQPTTGSLAFTITNTTVSNNGFAGIYFVPPSGPPNAHGVIDHVIADGNHSFGIYLDAVDASGGTTVITMSNSDASNNHEGIFARNNGASPFTVSIDNVSVSSNTIGIEADSSPNVLLGRSVITGNSVFGVFSLTSSNTFYTYQDNRINGNGTDISSPLSHSFLLE